MIENRLLTMLPSKDRKRLLARCDQIELTSDDILCEAGKNIQQVYFPTVSFISLLAAVDGKVSLEVGMVGNEGMFGIPLALGISFSPLQALVQGAGLSWRMNATDFQDELEKSISLRSVLNRYACVLMTQLSQTAACTRFHLVEARLARWLLMTQDRAHSNEFHLTHAFLAHMLGVRRVGVTKAASDLQQRNLISYKRGDIKILNLNGLKNASCECFQMDKESYDRILK